MLEGHLDQSSVLMSIQKEGRLKLLNSLTKQSDFCEHEAPTDADAEVNMADINV